jgi:hypothetical protein
MPTKSILNFVHNYKVTSHFSDDELGKHSCLVFGKIWYFCFLPRTSRLPPTAKMPHCGGLIMALNSSTPYIPRFDTLYEKKKNITVR